MKYVYLCCIYLLDFLLKERLAVIFYTILGSLILEVMEIELVKFLKKLFMLLVLAS